MKFLTFQVYHLEREASVIGKIRNDKQYIVHNNGEKIIDALAEEVTKGFLYDREYKKPDQEFHEPSFTAKPIRP